MTRKQTAAELIASRKANIASLIAQLQAVVAAVPADGNWAHAGDLGHIEEQLAHLVPKTAGPVLVQDEMTIWFSDRAARNAAQASVERRLDADAGFRPRGMLPAVSCSRTEAEHSDRAFGLTIDSRSDAGIDTAIDLLMDLATSLPGCEIVGSAEELRAAQDDAVLANRRLEAAQQR